MIDSLIVGFIEQKRIPLYLDSFITKYTLFRKACNENDLFFSAGFSLQYKFVFPKFDSEKDEYTIGLLFIEKFVSQNNKPLYKITKSSNRIITDVPAQWEITFFKKKNHFFLLNYRYAVARILNRRRLIISRKVSSQFVDYFLLDINSLFPTKDIDTYGFKPKLQIRLFDQFNPDKYYLSIFRL